MTIIPPSLREPLRRFKRYFGFFALSEGVIVLCSTLVWVALFFAERGLSPAAIRSTMFHEAGYWSPVLIFLIPAIMLIHDGRRMIKNAPISLFEFVATLGIVVATLVVFIVSLPPDL